VVSDSYTTGRLCSALLLDLAGKESERRTLRQSGRCTEAQPGDVRCSFEKF
jgi:hypothetical protein